MYKKDTLKNGLRIITSRMPNMESVAIGVWIGVGGRYEDKRLSGMSHLIEHMLFKGTASRTANALKQAIEGVGGSFNGFTSEEVTCYLVKLPARHLELGIDILSDMALNPKLDPGELEKEKYVICEEIKMYMDQPAQHVFDILAETMWPRHALGRPILGYADTVKNFKRDDLLKFMGRFYQPANMAIVATGKVERIKAKLLAKKIFFMPSEKSRFSYETVKNSHKNKEIAFFSKDTQQTHIAFGFHSIPRDHKLRSALTLLNVILGGNMSSRLFDRLREKKALCYDISSSVKRYKNSGSFIIHAGIDNTKLQDASREVMHELRDIKKSNVTDDELNRAKEYYKGQLLLALEDTGLRMLWLGEKILTEGKAPAINTLIESIEKVTADDVKKAANVIFDSKNLCFATVGPAKQSAKLKLQKMLVI